MKLILNGKEITSLKSKTVLELLKELNIDEKTVVVELNGNIIEAKDYETTPIKDDDKIEAISFVGGG